MRTAGNLIWRSGGFAVTWLLFLSFVTGKHDCYDRHRKEYIGNSTDLPATCTGCVCLPWPPEYGLAANYCRFVGGWDLPRCLVDNYLGLHLEDCNIKACDVHSTCYQGDGSDYKDGGEFTESGYQCLKWDSVQDRGVNSTNFPNADLRENFCRNPNGQSLPWCYFSVNGVIQHGFCQITRCSSTSAEQFHQLLFQMTAYSLMEWEEHHVMFESGNFSVERCLEECLSYVNFVCRSVIVDTFRQTCNLIDINQYYVEPVYNEHADLYTRRDTICDVFELSTYGDSECLLPLGLEVGLIHDAQLTASSYLNDDHAPWAGRLNGNFSWMPDLTELDPLATEEARPYLQIDFLERMKITGVIVQGGGQEDQGWVEEFEVMVTHDPVEGTWDKLGRYHTTVDEYGPTVPKIFQANRQSSCVQLILFGTTLYTRYLRINPTQWNAMIALRLEVIGCKDTGCDDTLGMINGHIFDDDIFASTSNLKYDDKTSARLAPFHMTPVSGWTPNPNDDAPIISVNLERPHVVTAIVTQGCSVGLVTSVKVLYLNQAASHVVSPKSLAEIHSTQLIGGNDVTSFLYRHTFGTPITCTTVIIRPTQWTGIPCLKLELIGCLYLSGCNFRLGMETGEITDDQLSSQQPRPMHTIMPATNTTTPRLHQWVGLSSGWILGDTARGDWLQIDLLTQHTITGVAVQAGRDYQYSLWVDVFRLLYALEGPKDLSELIGTESWRVYLSTDGSDMLFDEGFHSPYAVSRQILSRPFITKKIRIEPVSWTSVYPGLRAEVFGCELVEYGEFCGEESVLSGGFCINEIKTAEVDACDEIIGHNAVLLTIDSYTQLEDVHSLLRDSTMDAYLIGSVHLYDYGVVDEDGEYVDFTLPTDYCLVYTDQEDYPWQIQSCSEYFINERGSICQYDLDECAGNHGCSYKCLNYPGSYQCLCPDGFVLDSATHKDCVPVCSYFQGSTNSTWQQRDKWCYTKGDNNATWQEANAVCLSNDGGSRLPAENDEFWDGFNQSWNLMWVTRDDGGLPDTDCTAVGLADGASTGSRNITKVPCNTPLPYVCIQRFETVGEMTDVPLSGVAVNESFGLLRRWYYPPFIHNEVLTFEYDFSVPENHTVRFDFLTSTLKQVNNVCIDQLSIYDKFPDGSVRLRGHFCKKMDRGSVTSISSNSVAILQIVPWTEGIPQAIGITVTFTVVDSGSESVPKCGPTPPLLTDPTGSISTLDFPIPMNMACEWRISVDSNKFIRLNFTNYDVGVLSRIQVSFTLRSPEDEGVMIEYVLPFTSKPLDIISNSSEVTVSYLSASEGNTGGFRVEYTTVDIPGCYVGQNICNVICEQPRAYIASPLYPSETLDDQNCDWTIVTYSGTYIEVIFDSFDVPSGNPTCGDTYVAIFEGYHPSDDNIGNPLCNESPPDGPFQSHLNVLRVELNSEGVVGSGFLARYREVYFQPRREVIVTSDNCDPGWYYYKEHCYLFYSKQEQFRWIDAAAICLLQDAYLVSIRDSYEADFVHYMLTTVWWTDQRHTYIGLASKDEQGVFRWVDQSPMTYTDWSLEFYVDEDVQDQFEHNNPNGGRYEECTLIDLYDVKTPSNWIDIACAAMFATQCLCKTQATDYTEPQAIGNFVASEVPPGCPPHLFTCVSGECIHTILLCDTNWDCSDGSDEENSLCSGTDFEKFTFTCGDGETRIPASFYCNYVSDCSRDDSDEDNCVQPQCSDSQYRCDNGQCIDRRQRCDLMKDCIDGTDVKECEIYKDSFQCYSGRWIPARTQCDSYPDCEGIQYEDEIGCADYNCSTTDIQCRSQSCVDASHRCLYDLDHLGFIQGCRDVTHLRDCESFECPGMTFKCPNSYCIPIRFRCNNRWDCPNGEDEHGCDDYVCAGAYKCMSGRNCISIDKVCDGVYDCLDEYNNGNDDELFCNTSCPAGCTCVGLSYSCENNAWSRESADVIPRVIRQLFLNAVTFSDARLERPTGSKRKKRNTLSVSLTVEDLLFVNMSNYPWILDLELKNNSIVELTPGMFSQNRNMRSLNLSSNKIDVLRRDAFQGLTALQSLSLADNKLSEIEVGAFSGLQELVVLDIRNIQPVTTRDAFADLTGLHTIIASQYLFCCIKDDIRDCIAPVDQFSDCQDLISNSALRFFIWLLGLSALAGNLLVFGLRIVNSRRQRDPTPVQTFLITNLAASDFLMGVYMIIIAGADLKFRNNYALASMGWRTSITCKLAGLLSIVSSEVSVFVVTILSVDRFLKIVFPFRFGLHLTLTRVQWLMMVAWVVGLLVSLLPAVITVYFTEAYYGSSSVCLALPLALPLPSGWEYMLIILSVNLICFLIMLACYVAIFIAVKQSSQKTRHGKFGRTSQSAADIRIAMKMALIVGTDFVCWMPIIILAILASSATVAVPQMVYAWIAVFILPLNSSINPYLYTVSTYWGKRKKKKARSSPMQNQCQTSSPGVNRTQMSSLGPYTNDSLSADIELQPMLKMVLAQLEKHRIILVHDKEFCPSSLTKISSNRIVPGTASSGTTNPSYTVTEDGVASIVEDVTMALSWLHTNYISGIHLNEDSILFEEDCSGRQRAYLKLPQRLVEAEMPNGKQQGNDADIGIELDNKALKNLIGRFRNNIGITHNDSSHNSYSSTCL